MMLRRRDEAGYYFLLFSLRDKDFLMRYFSSSSLREAR